MTTDLSTGSSNAQTVTRTDQFSQMSPKAQSVITEPAVMQAQFAHMHRLSRTQPEVSWSTRAGHLNALRELVKQNQTRFAQAISDDFGGRSVHESKMAEMIPSLQGISYALKHGKSWMRTRRVKISAMYMPAHNDIQPQPLGVVGIMVPWNYPLYLAVGPMIDALCAGNRLMLKMSEAAPIFAQAFAKAVSEHFDPEVVSVVLGEVDVAQRFSQLPFDHLLYTGSTAVGKKVMAAAAPNLTPVTLELGGKSPVVILPEADLNNAVSRIMMGKLINAGQTCLAPDYVLLDKRHHQRFITLATQWVQDHYPDLPDNADYTHIINQRQFERLHKIIEQTPTEQVHSLSQAPTNPHTRLLPPVVLSEQTFADPAMQEELFGPILPLVHSESVDASIELINQHPRPLALYVFGDQQALIDQVRARTTAGGMCVNETLLHVAQHELPFGGVGASGMGHYHGRAGFERMSHLKPVFVQSRFNAMNKVLPPYGPLLTKAMDWLLK